MSEIRRFTSSDSISKLTQLVRKAFEPLARMGLRYNGTWQDDEKTRSRILGKECYVVESAGELIGTILLQPPGMAGECAWYGRPGVASFHQFAVAPEHQGQGIGAKLLEFVEERAAEIGAKELSYDTAEPANHLIHYYRPRGFRFVQYHQWGDTNYRSVVMSKQLSRPLGSAPGYVIDSLPVLSTDRLSICHLSSVTPKQMVDFHRKNVAYLASTQPPSLDDIYAENAWIARLQSAYEETCTGAGVRLAFLPREDPSRVIGTVGLGSICRGPFQACYLGYALDQDYCGKGLMTEALRRIITYAFSDLNLHRLMANHLPENAKSARVLNRLGFEREGIAKDYLFIGGRWRDHVLTALTNSSWQNIFG